MNWENTSSWIATFLGTTKQHPGVETMDGINMSKQPSRAFHKMWNSIYKTRISLWFKTIPHCHRMTFSLLFFSVLFLYPAQCQPKHTPEHCSHNRLCLTESSIVPHSRHRHYRSQWRCACRGLKPDTCYFPCGRDSGRQISLSCGLPRFIFKCATAVIAPVIQPLCHF